MKSITSTVFQIGNAVACCYLIHEKHEIYLIDTGVHLYSRTLIKILKCQPRLLNTVFITHADGDHCGAAAEIKKYSQAQIASSHIEAEAIRAGKMSRELRPHNKIEAFAFKLTAPFFSTQPAPVDIIISPGMQFNILGGLEVIDSRGHTPDHISFFSASTGILFSGDSIFLKNDQLIPSFGVNCWNEALSKAAFERQMRLNPNWICGGHMLWRKS